MKKVSLILAAVIAVGSMAMFTGCGGDKYELYYREDSYKGDTSNVFSMDWDTMSLFAEMDEKMAEELPGKSVSVKGTELRGLFSEPLELTFKEGKKEDKKEGYFLIGTDLNDLPDLKDAILEYGDLYSTEYGDVYLVPYHIEFETFDALYVYCFMCPEDNIDELDIDRCYKVEFVFDIKE